MNDKFLFKNMCTKMYVKSDKKNTNNKKLRIFWKGIS